MDDKLKFSDSKGIMVMSNETICLPMGFKKNEDELLYKVSEPPQTNGKECIAKLTPESTLNNQTSFQSAIRLCLIMGQCFGLCPVLGICEKDTSKLRFSFYSARCVYSMISILGQCVIVIFCILYMFRDTDASFSSHSVIVFYGSNWITTMWFFRVAMQWPILSKEIAKIEATDASNDRNLIRRCNFSCICLLSMGALEHILADISGLALVIDCQPEKSLFDGFNLQSFASVWSVIDYNPVIGLYFQFVNVQSTFNWNFSDVFIICMCHYLISRLEQINNRVKAVRGKIVPSFFWRTMREDYSRATNLVRKVDNVISGIVFVSFANTLFIICMQLLHSLEEGIQRTPACHRSPNDRPMNGYEQAVYFIYSFSFLLVRSISMCLVASRVHTASRESALVLYDVPSQGYCIEVQRFLHQIQGDTVAITGLKFFNVKRGLVLTIAGTIVTYELVLMQFIGVTPTVSPPTIDIPLLFPTLLSMPAANSTVQ